MWFPPRSVTAGTVLALMLSPGAAAIKGGSDRLNKYLAAHSMATTSTAPTVVHNNTIAPELVQQALSLCPANCENAGLHPSNWTQYSRLGRLSMCNETMLLDFVSPTSVYQDETLRACTANFSDAGLARRLAGNSSCLPQGNVTTVQEPLQLAFHESSTPATWADVEAATAQLTAALARRDASCTDTAVYAYARSVAVGFFAGAGVRDTAAALLPQLLAHVQSTGFSSSVVVQLCANSNHSTKYSFGIAMSGDRDARFVQEAVATWAAGDCLTSFDRTAAWQDIAVTLPILAANGTTLWSNSTANTTLARRDTCTTVAVVSGDSCATLATECGISAADFTVYNANETLCSTLQVGQHVCCSAGDLPDFRPQASANGSCFSYYVQSGDSCSSIGAANSLTTDEIESFNNDTWAWEGCSNLQAYQYICLSTGDPPMPASISNAVCGPQVPGTEAPASGVELASLNPCPLNACCDKYGQCGINQDFCTVSESETGAPGTSAAGQNGCISNCGTDIVVGSSPAESISIGYFEAYNLDRPCLNMKITAMDLTPYTHIHLAFGQVTTSYEIDVSSIQDQWELFLEMSGFKKILSLGGWSFSTDPSTYSIFRDAVLPENQDTFVANIVSFVEENGLDGIDIDWEYPGAPDIPGIPAGTTEDADNYLTFFQKLSAAMPSNATLSFCAPASYWYLKAYHIDEMADLADYIVYMTYDLHGQWDYANQFSVDGCPAGNCLRSHVNLTETLLALSMITKAGAPSNKIAVGVASYGRAFLMTTPGCTGPMCTFVGSASGALPGPCTDTAGYIANAEIEAILAGTGTLMAASGALQSITSYSSSLDNDSQSNIAVYDETQWVGYMDDDLKADRTTLYASYNFAGVVDWAIDLQGYGGDSIDYGASSNVVYPPASLWTSAEPLVGCEPPCIVVFPPYPLGGTHTVTSWPVLTTTLLSSGDAGVATVTTTIPVPAFSLTDVSLQPLTLQETDTATYKINPVQSITPASFVYTLPANYATFPVTTPPTVTDAATGTGTGTSTGTSTNTTVPLAVVPVATFVTTPVAITIQPQPTFSVDYPAPSVPVPPVTVQPTSVSSSTCSGSGCGTRDCSIFGCTPGCGLFACDGGCGIFGCGGGCGVLGCSGSCPLSACGGLGCLVAGGCGDTQGSDGGDSSDDCEQSVTASACTYLVSSYSAWYLASSTLATETTCVTSTACNGEDTVTTTTPGSPECTLDTDVESALTAEMEADETMIDGQEVPLAFAPTNDADYDGSTFTATEFGLTSPLVIVVTSTTTVTPTKTTTVVVEKTVQADCGYIITDLYYTFEVYNIENWSTDGGASLKKEEKGCGAITDWEWYDATSDTLAKAYFNLPFLIKSGCVERAIVSAGGPKLSCDFLGYDTLFRRRSLPAEPLPPPALPASAPTTVLPYRRDATQEAASLPSHTSTLNASNASSLPLYTPESWGTGDTVTFTTAVPSVSTWTNTTEVVLATMTLPTTTLAVSGNASSLTSTDGYCGADYGGATCAGSVFGDCCSSSGQCGANSTYCAAETCDPDYGSCTNTTVSASTKHASAMSDATVPLSTDGTCSFNSDPEGMACAGSGFGDCCSEWGFCGNSSAYCGTGCQAAFGSCTE